MTRALGLLDDAVSFVLRDASAEHVQALEVSMAELERESELWEWQRARDQYAVDVDGIADGRRAVFLNMLMREVVKRRLLVRWEVVVTRRCFM